MFTYECLLKNDVTILLSRSYCVRQNWRWFWHGVWCQSPGPLSADAFAVGSAEAVGEQSCCQRVRPVASPGLSGFQPPQHAKGSGHGSVILARHQSLLPQQTMQCALHQRARKSIGGDECHLLLHASRLVNLDSFIFLLVMHQPWYFNADYFTSKLTDTDFHSERKG